MNTVKNLHLLSPLLNPEQLDKLDLGAKYYLRLARVTFKVSEVSPARKAITVRATQEKNPSGNYLEGKDLIERGKELFSQFLPDIQVNVHPVPYKVAPVEIVTPEWIQKHMLKHLVNLKTLVSDTGIDKASLSAVINGLKPLSQSMKCFFFYYFLDIEKTKLFSQTYEKGIHGMVWLIKPVGSDFAYLLFEKIKKESGHDVKLIEKANEYLIQF